MSRSDPDTALTLPTCHQPFWTQACLRLSRRCSHWMCSSPTRNLMTQPHGPSHTVVQAKTGRRFYIILQCFRSRSHGFLVCRDTLRAWSSRFSRKALTAEISPGGPRSWHSGSLSIHIGSSPTWKLKDFAQPHSSLDDVPEIFLEFILAQRNWSVNETLPQGCPTPQLRTLSTLA